MRQTLLIGTTDFMIAPQLEMLITLDVLSSRDRAPFSRSSKNAAVTKKGANVLTLKMEFHPSKRSSSYVIFPWAKYSKYSQAHLEV